MKRLRTAFAVLLVAAFVGLRPVPRTPESGPIVQRLGSVRATVLVHTAEPRRLTLVLRAGADGADERSTQSSARVRRHVFTLEGLEPATRYTFSVRDVSGSERGEGGFRTAPRAGSGALRFVAFGDSGALPWWVYPAETLGIGPAPWLRDLLPGRGGQWQLAARARAALPDLVLHLGDLVYPKGARAHYPEACFRPLAGLLRTSAFYVTPGNHDLMSDGGSPLRDLFEAPGRDGPSGGRWYDFAYGPVRFFCVDSISRFPDTIMAGSAQRRWLAESLAAATEPWRVVFTHRPFLSASRHRLDPANERLHDELHALFASAGVSLVLSGHDHVYTRFEPEDGVSYVVAGAGGKSLYELVDDARLRAAARRFSFVVVDADPRRLRLRAVASSGDTIDAFELHKP